MGHSLLTYDPRLLRRCCVSACSCMNSDLTRPVGCHDNGYVPVLESLITQGLHSKLTLLSGTGEIAGGIKQLRLRTLRTRDIFESSGFPSKKPTSGGIYLGTSVLKSPPQSTPLLNASTKPLLHKRSASLHSDADTLSTSTSTTVIDSSRVENPAIAESPIVSGEPKLKTLKAGVVRPPLLDKPSY
jgi:hypothetical protein